jgi:hypothetical protein
MTFSITAFSTTTLSMITFSTTINTEHDDIHHNNKKAVLSIMTLSMMTFRTTIKK